jgi:anti-sigma regulatory factor (Ser/Thr protein kinase)
VDRTSHTDDRPEHALMQLTGQSGELAAARRWARETLPCMTGDELDDLLLIVNELVSNAFDHGRGPYALRLRQFTEPCSVRIEVDDASPELPVLGNSRIGDHRGRGLIMINALAKDWGVTPGPTGKTVWAEITCESQGPHGTA